MAKSEKEEYEFCPSYREEVILSDGTRATLRLVIPADKPLLERGMDNFSPESRFRRFLSAKQELTSRDLRYLTEIDGVDHFAIGALDRMGNGMGVARFVRFGDDREAAEPAVAVLDMHQNKGLGRILLTRLASAARERGIRKFRGSILSSNAPMLHLLHFVAEKICFEYHGAICNFTMPLEDITERRA